MLDAFLLGLKWGVSIGVGVGGTAWFFVISANTFKSVSS